MRTAPDIEKVNESKSLIHARPKRVREVMASLWNNSCYDKYGKLDVTISANIEAGGIFDEGSFSADIGGQDEEFPSSILSVATLQSIARLKRQIEKDLLQAFQIPNFKDSSAWIYEPHIGVVFDEDGEEIESSTKDEIDRADKEIDERSAEFFGLTMDEFKCT